MSTELLPCPFCGSKNIEVKKKGHDYGAWRIFCRGCGSSTAPMTMRANAIMVWNKRAEPRDDVKNASRYTPPKEAGE